MGGKTTCGGPTGGSAAVGRGITEAAAALPQCHGADPQEPPAKQARSPCLPPPLKAPSARFVASTKEFL